MFNLGTKLRSLVVPNANATDCFGKNAIFCSERLFFDSKRAEFHKTKRMGLRKSPQKKKIGPGQFLLYFFTIVGNFMRCESIETLGAFFVDFLKSISSNKGQSKTEKCKEKEKW